MSRNTGEWAMSGAFQTRNSISVVMSVRFPPLNHNSSSREHDPACIPISRVLGSCDVDTTVVLTVVLPMKQVSC